MLPEVLSSFKKACVKNDPERKQLMQFDISSPALSLVFCYPLRLNWNRPLLLRSRCQWFTNNTNLHLEANQTEGSLPYGDHRWASVTTLPLKNW